MAEPFAHLRQCKRDLADSFKFSLGHAAVWRMDTQCHNGESWNNPWRGPEMLAGCGDTRAVAG